MSTYGLIAEFEAPDALLRAAEAASLHGYKKMDAYSPFPIDGLGEAVGLKGNRVAVITLVGGISGGLTGYFMQWYANVVSYPINIGGRPYHSWPAFIPITFELTILFAALSAAFGMFALNHLPQLHHPIFNGQDFKRASKDRFFLCIQTRDPSFELIKTGMFLMSLKPVRVTEVSDDD
jgi:hypothetical protein